MQGSLSGCAAAAPSSSIFEGRHHALLHLTASISGDGSACILLQAAGLWKSDLAVECTAHLTRRLSTSFLKVAHQGNVILKYIRTRTSLQMSDVADSSCLCLQLCA